MITPETLATALARFAFLRRNEKCTCIATNGATNCSKHLESATDLITKFRMMGFEITGECKL